MSHPDPLFDPENAREEKPSDSEPVEYTFGSWEEASEAYYKYNQCNSDNPDKEEAAIMRWLDDMEYTVKE